MKCFRGADHQGIAPVWDRGGSLSDGGTRLHDNGLG